MDTPTKRCKMCQRELPATPEYFNRDNHAKDGMQRMCRDCQKAMHKRWYKEVSQTQAYKEAEQQRLAIYREANGDEIRRRGREQYHANHAIRRTQARENYRRNRDKILQTNKEWAVRNPDKVKAIVKRSIIKRADKRRDSLNHWRKTNPHKTVVQKQLRRARKSALPDTFTATDWQYCLEYWDSRCAYCGNPPGLLPGMKLTADHWIPVSDPHSPGTVPENMLPACGSCNSSKCNRNPHEWLTKKQSKRKAKQTITKVEVYFAHVKSRKR